MGTALVVGLLVGMCGAIAYVGDLLGRRMGKKRLTLFGLRPRHTAVVFTVITGMVIAGLTLTVLFFASAGVRIALTKGEQLLQDNRQLQKQRGELGKHVHRLNRRNGDLVQVNRKLQAEERRLREATTLLIGQNQALQQKNQDLGTRNEKLEQRNTRLASNNQALTARNGGLTLKNSRLAGTNRRLSRTSATLLKANIDLKGRNRRLLTANADLEQARDHAQAGLGKAQKDLSTAKSELAQTEKRALGVLQALRKDAETLGQQIANLEVEREQAAVRAAELETGQVVVRAGGELARRVIVPGTPAAQVRRAIEELLNEADAEVARREAQYAPGRSSGARPRRVQLAGQEGTGERLLETMVARLLTESHAVNGRPPARPMPEIHPLVLRAVARVNAAAGTDEPVVVDVVGKVNMLAFRRGQEVASLEVPTASTTGQLLKTLVSFLQRQVRENAMARSVLPDAAGQVGEIDPEALLDVVAKVKRLPGNARVGIVAAQDVWSAGPLRLDFFVVPVDTQVAREKSEAEE